MLLMGMERPFGYISDHLASRVGGSRPRGRYVLLPRASPETLWFWTKAIETGVTIGAADDTHY